MALTHKQLSNIVEAELLGCALITKKKIVRDLEYESMRGCSEWIILATGEIVKGVKQAIKKAKEINHAVHEVIPSP